MLLSFEKIVVPCRDPALDTNPNDQELAWIKAMVDFHKGNFCNGKQHPKMSQENFPSLLMLTFGILCEGDRNALNKLGHYLQSWEHCSVEEISSVGFIEDEFGGTPVLHKELLDHLERKFPPYSVNPALAGPGERIGAIGVNNLPADTIRSLRDVLLAAQLHRKGAGTAFVDRHDWYILGELAKAALPLNTSSGAVPWIREMGFANTKELVDSIAKCIDTQTIPLVDEVMTLEVPCFDDIPIGEILRYKRKDRFQSVINRIQELQAKNGVVTRDQIAEMLHKTLQDAFDKLRPTTTNLVVAIAGAAPVPIINPFSLWSIGQEVRNRITTRKRFDTLIVLSELRQLARKA